MKITMELKQYFAIILKWLWLLILLPTIAVGVAAYRYYSTLTPIYQAKATLIVISKANTAEMNTALRDISVSSQLISDYKEIVKSRRFSELVVQNSDIKNLTPWELPGKVNVNFRNDSRVLEVRVIDMDPERARDIANKVSDVFVSEVKNLVKVENIEILDRALTPGAPLPNSPYRKMMMAFIMGLMIAGGIALLVEYLDDSIKTSDDIEKHLGLTVLGTIPEFDIK